MKCLVLCAGYGTRLGKLTKNKPKCMIKVGGKPVLEHILDYLKKYGITEVIVNTHYKSEKIMKYFGTRVLYLYEPELLGELGTVRALRKWLEDDWFLIINGDTITDLKLRRAIKTAKELNSSCRFKDLKGIHIGITLINPNQYWTYLSKSRARDPFKKSYFLDYHVWWQDMGTIPGLRKLRRYLKNKDV